MVVLGDRLLCDSSTGETMARALSVCMMMNKKTRRLSKMPVDVRTEIQGYFVEDERKLTKLDDNTAEYIRKGLTARWSNLDINQHVNNVRYIGWILEVLTWKGRLLGREKVVLILSCHMVLSY